MVAAVGVVVVVRRRRERLMREVRMVRGKMRAIVGDGSGGGGRELCRRW